MPQNPATLTWVQVTQRVKETQSISENGQLRFSTALLFCFCWLCFHRCGPHGSFCQEPVVYIVTTDGQNRSTRPVTISGIFIIIIIITSQRSPPPSTELSCSGPDRPLGGSTSPDLRPEPEPELFPSQSGCWVFSERPRRHFQSIKRCQLNGSAVTLNEIKHKNDACHRTQNNSKLINHFLFPLVKHPELNALIQTKSRLKYRTGKSIKSCGCSEGWTSTVVNSASLSLRVLYENVLVPQRKQKNIRITFEHVKSVLMTKDFHLIINYKHITKQY